MFVQDFFGYALSPMLGKKKELKSFEKQPLMFIAFDIFKSKLTKASKVLLLDSIPGHSLQSNVRM